MAGIIAQQIDAIPPAWENRFEPPLRNLLNIFTDYDAQDSVGKKTKIIEAAKILERLLEAIDVYERK